MHSNWFMKSNSSNNWIIWGTKIHAGCVLSLNVHDVRRPGSNHPQISATRCPFNKFKRLKKSNSQWKWMSFSRENYQWSATQVFMNSPVLVTFSSKALETCSIGGFFILIFSQNGTVYKYVIPAWTAHLCSPTNTAKKIRNKLFGPKKKKNDIVFLFQGRDLVSGDS